jgi:hypothetical protein
LHCQQSAWFAADPAAVVAGPAITAHQLLLMLLLLY